MLESTIQTPAIFQRFTCDKPGCEKHYKNKSSLLNHIRTNHKGDVRLTQSPLGNFPSSARVLFDDGENSSTQGNSRGQVTFPKMRSVMMFQCGVCDNHFNKNEEAIHHMKEVHNFPPSPPARQSMETESQGEPMENAVEEEDEDEGETSVNAEEDDDEEAFQEAVEDQELYEALNNIEGDIKDKETEENKVLIEKLQRLRVIIKKKNQIQKEFKAYYDLEVSNRNEVEESQRKDITKLEREIKNAKERNLSILKESKKKKKAAKDLEKEKVDLNKDLETLRVKNSILFKDNSDLITDNKNKAIYIDQLKKNDDSSNKNTPEIVEVERPVASMNKDSNKHNCNACDRTFAKMCDLERHIKAKHEHVVCTFCEKTFNTEKQLEGHMTQCLEYGNTIVKCHKCHDKFTRFGIKRHTDTCKEAQNNVYACSMCAHRGSSIQEVKKHQADTHSDEVIEVSKEVCKHWRKGNCFKGNNCLYSHVGYQQKVNSNDTPKQNTNSWTPVCRHGEGCSWLSRGNCRYFHKGVGVQKPASGKSIIRPSLPQGRQDSRKQKMCHFDRKCTNTMCQFKHSSDKGFPQQRGQNRPQTRVLTNGRFNQ